MKSRLLTLAMLALALLAASCSKTKDSLLEGVPHDMDYVVMGDLQSIIKSAGGSIDGSKITVPDFIAKELGTDDEDNIEKLNESEAMQLELFARFITNNSLVKHLLAKNWSAFSRGYNAHPTPSAATTPDSPTASNTTATKSQHSLKQLAL